MSWSDATDKRAVETPGYNLTRAYHPVAEVFDEMMDPAGGIRPQ